MNSRLVVAAHVVGWIAWVEREENRPVTSEELARSVGTNPVVVRRFLARLAEAGIVISRRGAGGGSSLARDPRSITLREVFEAVQQDDTAVLGRYPTTPTSACGSVAPVLASYLDEVLGDAEEALKHALGRVSIDRMSREIVERMRRHCAPSRQAP